MKWLKHPVVTALLGLALGMIIISIASDCPEPIPPPPTPTQAVFNALATDFNARYSKLQDENIALESELNQVKASQTQQFVELKGQYDQVKRDYSSLLAQNAELLAVFNPNLVSEYSILRARFTVLLSKHSKLELENVRLLKELEDAK